MSGYIQWLSHALFNLLVVSVECNLEVGQKFIALHAGHPSLHILSHSSSQILSNSFSNFQ